MMCKPLHVLMLAVVAGCLSLTAVGCSRQPPPKTTLEKLNSDNAQEQREGLDEADRLYGGGQ